MVGGDGPPLLLLHGYPQTLQMWRAIAPVLAQHHTVIATDLAGYGDSFRPRPSDGHHAYSKHAMALDQVEAMAQLGHDSFAVAGHDRGGRVAYRMALDHPARVRRLAVLDIVPTGEVWARTDAAVARGYWHWAFLALPAPLPERLIAGDPDAFFDLHVRGQLGLSEDPDGAYRRTLRDEGAVQAMCEDYRAPKLLLAPSQVDVPRNQQGVALLGDSRNDGGVDTDVFGAARRLPLEFADAAYRYGHAQIRDRYRVNATFGPVPLFPDLMGFGPVSPAHTVDWALQFDQRAKRIDARLPRSLITLPTEISGAQPGTDYASLANRAALGVGDPDWMPTLPGRRRGGFALADFLPPSY